MLRCIASACFAVLGSSAHAGLIGSTLNAQYQFQDAGFALECDLGTVSVASGLEYPDICAGVTHDTWAIDVSDDYVDVLVRFGTGFANTDFNGWKLDFLTGPTLTGVDYLGGSLGVTGLILDFSDNALWINMAGQRGPTVGQYYARIGVTSVPEPTTILLLVSGAVGMLLSRRSAPTHVRSRRASR